MRVPPLRATVLKPMSVRIFPLFLTLAFPSISSALEIRDYSPTRHDRFVDGAGGRELNPDAYYDSERFTGVGYGTNTNDNRQFALVTPRHVLFAKHFAFGGSVAFLNTEGDVISRNLGSTMQVPNDSGGTSDVLVFRLSAPLTEADRITPLPYLNLANETAYLNTVLTTFGKNTRAGRGRISAFADFSSPMENIERTRTFNFTYSNLTGNRDDAHFETGDSGSPSFAIVNNRPALVGIHLAISTTFASVTNIDSFVPHYAERINALLAPEGYQLIPAYPDPVTLGTSLTGNTLREEKSGSLTIELANTSANTATNPTLDLLFPQNAIPDSVTAPGWIVENPAPGDYRLRRATLDGNSATIATASYGSVPVLPEIVVELSHRSDGSQESSETFTVPVQETFAGFVSALSQTGRLDDADLDGFGNLIEYALGGDPASNSATTPQGIRLAPVVSIAGNTFSFSFPRRTDAAARGLTYEIQFSETLAEDSFTPTPPTGFTTGAEPYEPDVPGFEKVTITIPADTPEKIFMRLKIGLEE